MFIVIAIVCIRWLPASANRWHNLTVRCGTCGDPMQISLSMLKRAYELHFHVYCRLTQAKERDGEGGEGGGGVGAGAGQLIIILQADDSDRKKNIEQRNTRGKANIFQALFINTTAVASCKFPVASCNDGSNNPQQEQQ